MTESVINPTHRPIFETVKVYTEKANEISAQIVAASSDKDALLKQTLKTSDHPDIVRWRKGVEKLDAQIKAAKATLAEAHEVALKAAKENTVSADVPDGFSVADATKEFLAQRQAAHGLRKTLKDMAGGDEKYLDAAYAELGIVEVVSPKGLKVLGGAAGTTTKPRLNSAYVDGEAVTPATFTNVAKAAKVTLDDLRNAAVKAAGVDDIRTKANEDIEIVLNGKTIIVNVKPAATAATSETTTDEKSEDSTDESTTNE
jgi:hypothetical protein